MRSILTALMMILLSASAYAYDGYDYVTPDSWSRNITANGVRAATDGIDLGNGTLKLGLTTRGYFGLTDSDNSSDKNVYQYFRARLSDVSLLNGTVSATLNLRGAWDIDPYDKPNEKHVFKSSLELDEWGADGMSLRLYQANVNVDGVIPMTNISIGRLYLDMLSDWKVDGAKVVVAPMDLFKVGAYYGLPVSYYSDLQTQAFGGYAEVPISILGTKIRAEGSYFISDNNSDMNTLLIKGRVDQYVSVGDFVDANISLEGAMINDAIVYDVGLNANVFASGTGLSAYVMGQVGNNAEGTVNTYVSSYESLFGDTNEFMMYGVMLSQGITQYAMISAGFEGKFNTDVAYANRDYTRFFGQIDLVGLIHRNNYISLIADYYNVPETTYYYQDSKLLGGFRVSQIINENIDLWAGANVMNYQFHGNASKVSAYNNAYTGTLDDAQDENNALAYIGGMWKITDWCVVQLDYTYEYSSIFESYDLSTNNHIVQAWVNFLF